MQRISCLIRMLGRWGLAVLLLGTNINSHAQPELLWQRSYERTSTFLCRDITALPSGGGALVSGLLDGPTSVDAFVMGVGDNGDSLWTLTYGSPSRHEWFTSMNPSPDGNFVFVAGSVEPPGLEYYLIWGVDSIGQVLWENELPWTIYLDATATAVDESGNIFVAGMSTLSGLPVVLKCDSDGQVQWQRLYDLFGPSRAEGIVVNNGSITVLGYQSSMEPETWLMCLDSDGEIESSEIFPSTMQLLPRSLQLLESQSFLASGKAVSDFRVGAWIGLASPQCEVTQQDTFKSATDGIILDAVSLDSTNTIVCGRELLADFGWTFFIACVNNTGDILWESSHEGNGWNFSNAGVDRGQNGELWACAPLGYALSFDVMKFDASTHVGADNAPRSPEEFSLSTFPNPFNSTLSIALDVLINQEVNVGLYDLLGREVGVIHRGRLASSTLSYAAPGSLASGVYFVRAVAGNRAVMRKVVLLK